MKRSSLYQVKGHSQNPWAGIKVSDHNGEQMTSGKSSEVERAIHSSLSGFGGHISISP